MWWYSSVVFQYWNKKVCENYPFEWEHCRASFFTYFFRYNKKHLCQNFTTLNKTLLLLLRFLPFTIFLLLGTSFVKFIFFIIIFVLKKSFSLWLRLTLSFYLSFFHLRCSSLIRNFLIFFCPLWFFSPSERDRLLRNTKLWNVKP